MSEIVRIANEALAVDVSSLGAEMQTLRSSDGRSWLWNGDASFWAGRSPVLFPIVGKAPDNRLLVDGEAYEMQQHGIARRSEFALLDQDATSCLHELLSSAATKALYPFDFRLTLRHALDGERLSVTAEVFNTDSRPLPFGIGFHPAFLWPLPGAEGKRHYVQLANGAEPPRVALEAGLRQPGTLASPFDKGQLVLDHPMFDDDALIFPEGAGHALTYCAEDGPSLNFSFENLPNLALWSKPGQAPFVCIEPWHGTSPEIGASAELAARPYSISLEPGNSMRFGFSVNVAA